jgi:hypothetical protein
MKYMLGQMSQYMIKFDLQTTHTQIQEHIKVMDIYTYN